MATELHLSHQLAESLNTQAVVASIGPTCTSALQSYGVTPHVIPEHPKMGHLVKALAQHMT
jgi:uroporphyrinogen-III synthase